MGIRLDWETDSPAGGGRAGRSYTPKEDPERRRARTRARLRGLILLCVVALFFVAVGAIVTWRLNQANAFIESLLRDTVEAEFAALRLGDWNAYSNIQRSATSDWLLQQRERFDSFQAMKMNNSVDLTGTVHDIEIDGTRGRVMVEWIENGSPITQTWFYWRYENSAENSTDGDVGGWRHVPADLTFWGSAAELKGSLVSIAYKEVDSKLAEEMRTRIEGWISSVCGPILQCGDLPHISIDIRPDFYLNTHWDGNQPWRLLVRSPYIDGARADSPFAGDTLHDVATALAERLVGVSVGTTAEFSRTSEAGMVITAAQNWVYSLLTQNRLPVTSIIDSLAAQRGTAAVGQLLHDLRPDSTLELLLTAFGTTNPMDTAIDWSGYLRDRILLESDLITAGDTDAVASLYIEEMRSRALERLQAAAAQSGVEVRLVQAVTAPDGSPALIASVIIGSGADAVEENVYFYWRDSRWLRAS